MTLCHQVSLRISDEQRAAVRTKLREMRSGHLDPNSVTEADAHRALLDEARAASNKTGAEPHVQD